MYNPILSGKPSNISWCFPLWRASASQNPRPHPLWTATAGHLRRMAWLSIPRSAGAKEVWCPWVNHCSRVCIYRCIHTGPWISHCNHASPIVTGLTTPQLGFRMVTTNGVKGQLSQPPTMMGPKGSTIRADWKFIAMKEVCGTEVVGVHDWRRLRVFDHDSVRTEVGMMTSYRPNWQAKSSGLWTKSVNGGIYR